jgi:hypothetical protein
LFWISTCIYKCPSPLPSTIRSYIQGGGGLSPKRSRRALLLNRKFFRPAGPAEEPDEEAERGGAGGVEQDIDGGAGAAGDEGLVDLIAGGDYDRGEDGENRRLETPWEQRSPALTGEGMEPGTQEGEGYGAVSDEVSGLAQVVVE